MRETRGVHPEIRYAKSASCIRQEEHRSTIESGRRSEPVQVNEIDPATVVPEPGCERTSRVPPSAEIRSSMLVSPNPR